CAAPEVKEQRTPDARAKIPLPKRPKGPENDVTGRTDGGFERHGLELWARAVRKYVRSIQFQSFPAHINSPPALRLETKSPLNPHPPSQTHRMPVNWRLPLAHNARGTLCWHGWLTNVILSPHVFDCALENLDRISETRQSSPSNLVLLREQALCPSNGTSKPEDWLTAAKL
ncbi:hypothetical protein CSAL01_11970, partial [Colletotrichum salicis]